MVVAPPAAPLPPEKNSALDRQFENALALPRPSAVKPGVPISLVDAVRLTLSLNPQINLSREDTVLAKAALQVATSAFDARLTANATYNRARNEVTPSELRDRIAQREGTRDALRAVQSERLLLEAARDQGSINPNPGGGRIAQLQSQINDILNTLTLQNATPQQQANVAALQRTIAAEVARENQIQINALLDAEARTRASLRAQGVQSADSTTSFNETATLSKLLRNGISLAPNTNYTNSRTNNTLGTSRATVGFNVNVPLARGLGESDTAAQERASKIDYQASLLQLRHNTSINVQNTALAYWACLAAQERLALLRRSELIAGTLLEVGRIQVQADQLAPADLALSLARQAETTNNRVQGELALLNAQQQLAVQIGLEAKDIPQLLTAVDPFPDVVSDADVASFREDALTQAAIGLRADRQASSKLEVSGKVLAESARLEQRPRVDFNGRFSWSAVNEGNAFAGYFSAYGHNYTGPSFAGTLSVDWPIANNFLKGQYLQSLAQYNRSVIRTTDIVRNIASNVVFVLGSVRTSLVSLRQAGLASDYYLQSVNNQYQRYKLRDTTLIDAIDIETRLTISQLALVDARLQYAQSLVRLRFETGTLLTPTPGLITFRREDLVTLPAIRNLEAAVRANAK